MLGYKQRVDRLYEIFRILGTGIQVGTLGGLLQLNRSRQSGKVGAACAARSQLKLLSYSEYDTGRPYSIKTYLASGTVSTPS